MSGITPKVTSSDREYTVEFDGFSLTATQTDADDHRARLVWHLDGTSDDAILDPDDLRRLALECESIRRIITRV